MSTTLIRHRKSAYIAQSGRCYYCKFPLWESDLNSFARAYNIPGPKAELLKCTAEHLDARQDGGKNSKQNIVAACLRCNLMRHRMKPAPNPDAYRTLVQKLVKNGKWHKKIISRMVDI
jgi:5-methylcytosine-specific restriction endonuclease McrA